MEKFLNRKPIKRLIESIDEDYKKIIFIDFLNREYNEIISKPKRIDCFYDIIKNNSDKFTEKYNFYISSPSSYLAKEYRYGSEYVKKYKDNLMSRPKINRSKQNNYDPEYISKVHKISLSEAEEIINERKTKLTDKLKKRHVKYKSDGRNYRLYNPLCIEYWVRNFDDETLAKEYHKDYIIKTRTNKEGFSIRHGSDSADMMFNSWVENRRNTWLKKYGRSIPLLPNTSKESIRCFIPLYKKLRKLGFKREDICWGIKGSKEFAHHSNETGNVFYDFVIKPIKFVIEYNGSFWHSHPDLKYKGFLCEDKIIEKDYLKKKILEDKGYIVRYIWDFEDTENRRNEILNEIKELII